MKTSLALLCFILLAPFHHAVPRPVSHEDIREALHHIFRETTDKLERHENRERHLGEQLKKGLSTLDKRERAQDHVLENVVKLLAKIDERIQKLENSVAANEQEKGSYTVDTVPLQSLMLNMEGMLQQHQGNEHFITKEQLLSLQASVNSRLDGLVSVVENLQDNVLQSNSKAPSLDPEVIYSKVEAKMAEHGNWHNNVLSALDSHQRILSDMRERPNSNTNNNLTEEFQSLKHELSTEFRKEVSKIDHNIHNIQTYMKRNEENLIKVISEGNEEAEDFYSVIQKNHEQLSTDIKALSKVEKVLVQTADNVMDTRRRIEYGVQQILLEVGDLIKLQGKDFNGTMNRRFDEISHKILDNQNGGLTNLSSKIETEISQVWRQIGIMYQTLTASAGALDKLQQQTEIYVNGSLQTMDSMEGKVGQITGRMSEVDDNLNYLLGRLSLVTHEFNQIKTALANSLDNIRNSFKSVQQKIEEVGPGPNPIDTSSNTADANNAL